MTAISDGIIDNILHADSALFKFFAFHLFLWIDIILLQIISITSLWLIMTSSTTLMPPS